MRNSFVIAMLGFLVGCTKPNQAFCCETAAQCAMLNVDEIRSCAGAQVCDNGTCIDPECTTSAECTSPDAPFCANQICVGACQSNDDCVGVPGRSLCAPDGECVACVTDGDCASDTPVCDTTSRACRGCSRDDECPSTVCDLDVGACVASTAIAYASPAGLDANDCSQGSPCSLTRAVAIATIDTLRSTVRMTPGVFTTSITVIGGRPITIVGTDAKLTEGDGQLTISIGGGADVGVRGLQILTVANNATLQCSIDSTPSTLRMREVVIRPTSGTDALIIAVRCNIVIDRVDFNETALEFFTATTGTVDRSVLRGGPITNSSGIIVQQAGSTVTITNSVLDGVELSANGMNMISFSFNTIDGIEGVVATPGKTPVGITFTNNIIAATGFTDSARCATCTFTNNIIFPQTTPLTNNLLVAPGFVDPITGDFHLLAGSPAIDAADTGTVLHDFDGTPRPQGAKGDIGAFEFH